ncbi:hypothetical protein FE74_15410, partial [Staphylococcus aureus]
YADELYLDAILIDAESRFLQLSYSRDSDGFNDIPDVVGQVYETPVDLDQYSGSSPAIPTGYRDLNPMTAGFNRNDLIL